MWIHFLEGRMRCLEGMLGVGSMDGSWAERMVAMRVGSRAG